METVVLLYYFLAHIKEGGEKKGIPQFLRPPKIP
jgi:hypothetical protein